LTIDEVGKADRWFSKTAPSRASRSNAGIVAGVTSSGRKPGTTINNARFGPTGPVAPSVRAVVFSVVEEAQAKPKSAAAAATPINHRPVHPCRMPAPLS
jgi:hypothetical protein